MQRLLEPPARVLVSTVRGLAAHRLLVSAVALALTLVLGLIYLVFGALRVDPTASNIHVRVHLSVSGGLLPNQDVTLRGVAIGRVQSVELADGGVIAVAAIDSAVKIPRGGEVRVAGLSLAGEQYLDFRPTTDGGPYLTDGAEISVDQTSTPVALATLLGDLNGTLAQIDPAKLETIVKELGVGPEGPQKLAAILDGGTFLISTLDSVLPQTVSLLHDSKVVLGTLADIGPGLQATSKNLSTLLRGVESKDQGFRTFVDRAPATMHSMDAIIADNSPTMVQLLGNLTTVAQLAYVHVPALDEFFFPKYRAGSTLEAIATVFHDGGIWGLVNIYPRYSCDYDLARLPPSVPDSSEPYLHTYCPNQDPSVLIRGARNAPRPPGDDTAGPPAGVTPDERSTPTPVGPQSIPVPYGGPDITQPTPR